MVHTRASVAANAASFSSLSDDLVDVVLSHLPVASLARFALVSKACAERATQALETDVWKLEREGLDEAASSLSSAAWGKMTFGETTTAEEMNAETEFQEAKKEMVRLLVDAAAPRTLIDRVEAGSQRWQVTGSRDE